MEFYAFASVSTDSAQLQEALTITRLPDFCASIDEVFDDHGARSTVASLTWILQNPSASLSTHGYTGRPNCD